MFMPAAKGSAHTPLEPMSENSDRKDCRRHLCVHKDKHCLNKISICITSFSNHSFLETNKDKYRNAILYPLTRVLQTVPTPEYVHCKGGFVFGQQTLG